MVSISLNYSRMYNLSYIRKQIVLLENEQNLNIEKKIKGLTLKM